MVGWKEDGLWGLPLAMTGSDGSDTTGKQKQVVVRDVAVEAEVARVEAAHRRRTSGAGGRTQSTDTPPPSRCTRRTPSQSGRAHHSPLANGDGEHSN